MRTKDDLRQYQALPLDLKISLTQRRIRDWVNYWGTNGVYVSFSGGKDSTVLLHMVRELFPEVEAVFVNTGLEYPEIQQFVKSFDNVTILRPKMRFDEVIKNYGYPIIGKKQAEVIALAKRNLKDKKYSVRLRILGITAQEAANMGLELPDAEMLEKYEKSCNGSKYQMPKYKSLLSADFNVSAFCCDVMKKSPAYQYQKETGKKPFLATMADESMMRENAWLRNGCNAFDSKHPSSQPIAFWTQQDVLQYIKQYNIPIASVYGEVVEQTQIKNDGANITIQEQLFETGAQLCTTGCDRTGCIFCAFGCHLEKEPSRFQKLKKTHPRQYAYCIGGGEYDENGVWKPNKQGLGMGHVFDELNKITEQDLWRWIYKILGALRMRKKYKNTKVEVDGIEFDSKKEARRFNELKLLQRAGQITDLQLQREFELIPAQYETFERYGKRGQRLQDGQRCIEKRCVYKADFTYMKDGQLVVEDVKGYRDPQSAGYAKFVIKRKLLLERFGIRIIEI